MSAPPPDGPELAQMTPGAILKFQDLARNAAGYLP